MLRGIRTLIALVTFLSAFPLSVPSSSRAAVENTGLVSLPRRCGSTLPQGSVGTACCMFGYVFADGKPVVDAEVKIYNPRTDSEITVATSYGPDSNEPYYGVSLSEPPLNAIPGDIIYINIDYSTHFTQIEHVVLSGGQQVDGVIAKYGERDYIFDRQLREPMAPGEFGLFKGDVTVDGSGLVYVADYGNARIQVFNQDGSFIRQWGDFGITPGHMSTPSGVAIDRFGYVYVADYSALQVYKFTSAGTWISTWGKFEAGKPVPFSFPTDLTVDNDGYVYIVEQRGTDGVNEISRIQKWRSDGTFVKMWGELGSDPGFLRNPEGIAFGPDGLLYVADTGNNRIQVFDREGGFVRQWNGVGTAAGALDKPERLTVASDGRILVSDTQNHRIVAFSATGAYLQQWGEVGSGNNQLNQPAGISLDAEGTIYAVDQGNFRIQTFSSAGPSLRRWGKIGYPLNRLEAPIGLTRDNAGNLYIVDSATSLIRKYNAAGVHIADLGDPYNSGPAGLLYPYGIATNGTSELYIVDAGNSRIRVFSLTGTPLRDWGNQGSGQGQFNEPYGITVDVAGNVYVADAGNNRIQKFTKQGVHLWTQGGTGQSQMDFPVGVAVNTDGSTVYVTDTNNDRIQQLRASDGTILGQFGSYGTGDGEFSTPAGITFASDGTFLVADMNNYRIQRLDANGNFIYMYGGAGAGPGQLNQPTTILAVPDGRIILAERYQGRVQILRPVTFTRPVATIVAAPTLVVKPGEAVKVYGHGCVGESSRTITEYLWTLNGAIKAITSEATLSTAGLAPGSYTIGLQVRDNTGELSDSVSVTLNIVGTKPDPQTVTKSWTFLLYLSGDNPSTTPYLDTTPRLGAIYRLMRSLPNVSVAILFDGDKPSGGDTTRYLIRPNQQPSVEALPEANMGDPQTLVDFVSWGRSQAPSDAIYLSIADHGNTIDGTSWDFTSDSFGNERLLPAELQQALSQITDGGSRPIDVLHLDSCLMGSIETAYQLRGQARYLIASENLAWSAFAYDQYVGLVGEGVTPQQLASKIAIRYTELVGEQQLPYTIVALDLSQIVPLSDSVNAVAAELLHYAEAGQANRAAISAERQKAQLLDSTGDGKLMGDDEYIDLGQWLENISNIPDSAVKTSAEAALQKLTVAISYENHKSGSINGAILNIDGVTGLSIYYPPSPGARTYQTYRHNLSFADSTLWDEFLQAGLADLPPTPDPGPNPVAPLPFVQTVKIFLPVVVH